MKRYIAILILILLTALAASAQTGRREVRQGNRKFKRGEWPEADVFYRKALVKDSSSVTANYNLANNLYRQENYSEAAKRLDKLSGAADSLASGKDICFNRGDVAIAQKDWQKAVDSFRLAMLKDPSDLEAKENYAYARKMLEDQQQNGGGGNNQQNQDQDNQNQDQDNQNQDQDQNKDQNNQDQNSQDQNNQGQNNQSSQNQNQDQNSQGNQPKISQQQAQQMLQALQAQDEQTQDKVRKEKAQALKTQQKEKNW